MECNHSITPASSQAHWLPAPPSGWNRGTRDGGVKGELKIAAPSGGGGMMGGRGKSE
ncbi:hypothetical protein ES703_78553 [subsurface metagenome]